MGLRTVGGGLDCCSCRRSAITPLSATSRAAPDNAPGRHQQLYLTVRGQRLYSRWKMIRARCRKSAQPAASSDAFTSPILAPEERRVRLSAIDEGHVRSCTQCSLCNTRNRTVFGEGDAEARLMFIGEGPGGKEDQTGRPFVGPAGELLNRMIGAMGLAREQVYIANVVKCRAFMPGPSPKDRAPAAEEVAACSPYLQQQVEIIRPQVIVTLGLPATQFVLQTRLSMSRMRGNWNSWHGIKVMPTWHPSYLLRREKEGDVEPKRQAWNDLQKVMSELGLAAPKESE